MLFQSSPMEDFPLTTPSSFYSASQSFSSKSPLLDNLPQLGSTHLFHSSFDDPPILPSTNLSLKHSIKHCIKHVPGTSASRKISSNGDASDGTSSNYSSTSPKVRSCDVFIGVSGRDPMMIRFVKWLRAELAMEGVSCFLVDRSRCKSASDHAVAKATMDVAAFGVVVIGKRSFASGYSMEEIQFFLEKKKLVPIFFEFQQAECTARDIIERKGVMWEQHGGRLWEFYGGLESAWRGAVNGLSRLNLKLEANSSNFRDCILEAVVILGSGLGRRRVVERVKTWKELAKEEFPFPRNATFVGRSKELHELESLLFGSIAREGEDGLLEGRARPKHGRDEVVLRERMAKESEERRKKGKEPMVCINSTGEIGEEMEVYEGGAVCVTGDTGIGKTELLLEYAYRLSQRYKMILWVSGESRYLRQNYLKLLPRLGIDTSMVSKLCSDRNEKQSLEAMEGEAIRKVRKELARDIPYLLVIDNLERERDWWDGRNVTELLPCFRGATHVLISTRLPRIRNIKPLRLLYLSNAEAMFLMNGGTSDLEVEEVNALRLIEEKVGRLPFGLALVRAVLSRFSMKPSKLLDAIHGMPYRELGWNKGEDPALRHNPFLVQLLEFCLSSCGQGSSNLALRIVQASSLFPPSSIPTSVLSLAGRETFEERRKARFWVTHRSMAACMCVETQRPGSWEDEVLSSLVKVGIARTGSEPDSISFHDIVKLYAHRRGDGGVAESVVRAIGAKASLPHHSDHVWAACFLLFKFEDHRARVDLPIHDLLAFMERFVLPLAAHSFGAYFRGNAALELLRLATEKLEALEDSFLLEANNGSSGTSSRLRSSGPGSTLQSNPLLYRKFAHLRATLLETRAKIMLRGGSYDLGEQLCRTAVSIKEVIYGWEHRETASSRNILERLVRLRSSS